MPAGGAFLGEKTGQRWEKARQRAIAKAGIPFALLIK
ncbi:hypothetical protein Q770_08905 [Klebsiella pneumoniae subsp. pneumoniae PittNDM01]|nr:hypothetical protein Q770_08905 [Klebsiella pneumoniae subsp. pneumoniae PittNDM01]